MSGSLQVSSSQNHIQFCGSVTGLSSTVVPLEKVTSLGSLETKPINYLIHALLHNQLPNSCPATFTSFRYMQQYRLYSQSFSFQGAKISKSSQKQEIKIKLLNFNIDNGTLSSSGPLIKNLISILTYINTSKIQV